MQYWQSIGPGPKMTNREYPEDDAATPEDDSGAAYHAVEETPERQPIDWARMSDLMSAMRAAIVNAALLCFAVALIVITVLELLQSPVVIEPIRLPEALSAVGYTEDVAAQRLTDAIAQIKTAAPTTKQGVEWLPASQRVDFEAPQTGISLQNVVQVLRQALKLPETRISGEFICATPDCAQDGLVLRLRVIRRGGMKIIELPPVGNGDAGGTGGQMAQYYKTAALQLLRELDPYLVAAYLYDTDKPAAEREALKILGPTNPQRKWAMNLLGFIAADRKDYDTAIDWYRRAIAADKNFAFAYTNLGTALLAQAVRDKDKDGMDRAIAMHERAIKIDKDYSFAYLNLADALTAKGEQADAMANIALAAKKDPNSAYAYIKWGNALHELYTKGARDKAVLAEAIEKYRRATEIDPSSADAYLNWGIALSDEGKFDEAIGKYARVAELKPNYARVYVPWGVALRNKTPDHDFDGAIEKYRRATELDPSNAPAYYNWGRALHEKPDPDLDEAARKFARAAELAPKDADVCFQWGAVLRDQQLYSDAAEKFACVIALKPHNAAAHYNLGMAQVALNKFGDAANALQRYVELDPAATDANQVAVLIKQLRAVASGG